MGTSGVGTIGVRIGSGMGPSGVGTIGLGLGSGVGAIGVGTTGAGTSGAGGVPPTLGVDPAFAPELKLTPHPSSNSEEMTTSVMASS